MTTLVQSKADVSGLYGGTGAGINIAFPSAVTAGNAICATLTMGTAVVISSVTDSNGVALTPDKPAETVQQGNQNIYFYSLQNVSGSPTGINVKLTTAEKERAVENLKTSPAEIAGLKVVKTVKIDGTKFLLENDSWVLMRFSGTEPVVRYYAEARDAETLDRLCSYGEKLLRG